MDEFYKWFDIIDDMSKDKMWSKNTVMYFAMLAWKAGIKWYKNQAQQAVQADAVYDPVCRVCGDPLTTDELVCDACRTA